MADGGADLLTTLGRRRFMERKTQFGTSGFKPRAADKAQSGPDRRDSARDPLEIAVSLRALRLHPRLDSPGAAQAEPPRDGSGYQRRADCGGQYDHLLW